MTDEREREREKKENPTLRDTSTHPMLSRGRRLSDTNKNITKQISLNCQRRMSGNNLIKNEVVFHSWQFVTWNCAPKKTLPNDF